MSRKNERKERLHEELIASIEAEDRHFNMAYFVADNDDGEVDDDAPPNPELATCDTALCMAGHLEALRPELAAALAPQYPANRYGDGVNHEALARAIYYHETGEVCRLDFMGHLQVRPLDEITRADAIAHIRGLNDEWPLLPARAVVANEDSE